MPFESNELDTNDARQYTVPETVGVDELFTKHNDDESLNTYKKQLLGNEKIGI